MIILDPTAAPEAPTAWLAPRLDRSLAGVRVGLRLDRSWRCYPVVLDAWSAGFAAAGATVDRFVVDARVAGAGDAMRSDLAQWRQLVDCAVVGLGN